jgi:putative ABC transport system ATP-binding protein
MYSVLGTIGSGKTTFLSLLAGLDTPKEGTIYLNDENISDGGLTKYRKNDVSIIFQQYNLFPYMTAYQNVETAINIEKGKVGLSKEEKHNFIVDQLKAVGLDENLIFKKVLELSGGQQQRVAIVRALASGHDLIVADEPTGNLDETTSKEIISLFQTIAHEQNKTVIIVTHDNEVAEASDIVYELKNKEFMKHTA